MERKSDCIHEQVAKADCKCPLYNRLSLKSYRKCEEMTKVKICGLSRPEDIEAVNAYGADYAGIVFLKKANEMSAMKKQRC